MQPNRLEIGRFPKARNWYHLPPKRGTKLRYRNERPAGPRPFVGTRGGKIVIYAIVFNGNYKILLARVPQTNRLALDKSLLWLEPAPYGVPSVSSHG